MPQKVIRTGAHRISPGFPQRPEDASPDGKRNRGEMADFYAAILAMAAHDLRQPLQLILGVHELLTQRLADGPERRQLARAERASEQLAVQLDLLVDALRLHEHAGWVRKEPVALAPLFLNLLRTHGELARQKGINISVGARDVKVLSDPALLEGILRNLVRNAVDYTPRGGWVRVRCHRQGGGYRIAVRDTGSGISPAKVPFIFEAFNRFDARRPDGLGLGLFIVKRAADSLGHRIEVRSSARRGTCFSIIIAAADQTSPAVPLSLA
jgi:two-component system phosphate regulon sensor histidine kinase PhoR